MKSHRAISVSVLDAIEGLRVELLPIPLRHGIADIVVRTGTGLHPVGGTQGKPNGLAFITKHLAEIWIPAIAYDETTSRRVTCQEPPEDALKIRDDRASIEYVIIAGQIRLAIEVSANLKRALDCGCW